MKTKEEIERLAKQLCNIPIDLVIDEEERYYKNLEKYDGIIQGYTQCQKDNADKKYTEEDLRKAISKAKRNWIGYPANNSLEDAEVNFLYTDDEIIELLNKQD